MPISNAGERAQFSVKLPDELEDEIESHALETHRSKSNALIHLAHIGIAADADHVEDGADESGTPSAPISVSTLFTGVVDEIETLADDEFNGVFSRACRWAIRNGIAVENMDQ